MAITHFNAELITVLKLRAILFLNFRPKCIIFHHIAKKKKALMGLSGDVQINVWNVKYFVFTILVYTMIDVFPTFEGIK